MMKPIMVGIDGSQAAVERRAGATGLSRCGGASSVKVSGAQALRRCQMR